LSAIPLLADRDKKGQGNLAGAGSRPRGCGVIPTQAEIDKGTAGRALPRLRGRYNLEEASTSCEFVNKGKNQMPIEGFHNPLTQ
jgi:hypothetical protein